MSTSSALHTCGIQSSPPRVSLPSPRLAPKYVSISPEEPSESKLSPSSSSSPSSSHSATARRAVAHPARVLRLPPANTSLSFDDLASSGTRSESPNAQPTALALSYSEREREVTSTSTSTDFMTASSSMATSTSSSSLSSAYNSARPSLNQNSLTTSFESISLASPPSTSSHAHTSRILSESSKMLDRMNSSDSLRIQLTSPSSRISNSDHNSNSNSKNSSPSGQSIIKPDLPVASQSNTTTLDVSAESPHPPPDTLSLNGHPPSSSDSRHSQDGSSSQYHKTPNVYINGLPPYFPEDHLYALTKPYGVVKSVRSFTRRVGDRCSGYGFVLFDSIESAELCIESLRRYRNLHPSFSKQNHKIPGTSYAVSSTSGSEHRSQDGVTEGSKDGGDKEDLSFKAKMDKLADKTSTNLYVEGLPLSIDERSLAALVRPYAIKSSRFFQTKLSHPPKIIAFVRLETREAAEEIIERLHGRMVPGWNDPGSRISVRFADNNEQRELRRNERMAREGDGSPARLTIAQAALLNLHGKELQSNAPNAFLANSVTPLPASPYAHPALIDTSFLSPRYAYREHEADMEYMLDPLSGGAGEYLQYPAYQARRNAMLGMVDPASCLAQAQAPNGGFTPAEERILQAHSQGRQYGSMVGMGSRMGAVSPGVQLPSPHQQVLALQQQQAAALLAQQQQQMYFEDRFPSQQHHNSRPLQFSSSKARHGRHLATPLSNFDQQQQYSMASSSYPAQSSIQNQLQLRSTNLKDSHRSNSLLSNQQRHYQPAQHKNFQHNNSNKHSIPDTSTTSNNKRANHHHYSANITENNNSSTIVGSPFFEQNQNHHQDAMRHNGDVHRYTSGSYDNARFVVRQGAGLKCEAEDAQVSPALTYNSSRTPSTLSPATPFFGSFAQSAEVFEGNIGFGGGKKMRVGVQ